MFVKLIKTIAYNTETCYNIDIGKEVIKVDIIEKLTSLANALTPLVLALAILKLVSKD